VEVAGKIASAVSCQQHDSKMKYLHNNELAATLYTVNTSGSGNDLEFNKIWLRGHFLFSRSFNNHIQK